MMRGFCGIMGVAGGAPLLSRLPHLAKIQNRIYNSSWTSGSPHHRWFLVVENFFKNV